MTNDRGCERALESPARVRFRSTRRDGVTKDLADCPAQLLGRLYPPAGLDWPKRREDFRRRYFTDRPRAESRARKARLRPVKVAA